MVSGLGKRKPRDQIANAGTNHTSTVNQDSANLQSFFRQHFESTFEPLPECSLACSESHLVRDIDNEPSDKELESEWDGFSEDGEGEGYAETVHCASSASSKADISKDEIKTFMSTKPPSSAIKLESTAKRKQLQSTTDNDESSTDAANLKKDLALQRLLKESHLLDSHSSHSSLSHSGQNRHKALDLRLQDMGSKTSVFAQRKMPLAQRKGIAAKATKREELRRREAQANGIVLEKETKRKKKDAGMRQRGIGAPSIGRFQGGMLKLSKKDVAKIER